MTCRATRRDRVLISRGVHPHYRQTTRTYFKGGLELEEIPLVADGPAAGTTDLAALERMLAEPDRPVAGVIAAQPDFLGLLEPMPEIGRLAHAAGALFVAVIEPVSLAVLAPPGAYGADIAAGEGQPLGIAPQYGGPYLGILASTDALVRQIPGRLVGMTTDLDGQRAFVMTMRAREQDIRRDKAASNICTNQALLALAASIYLATIGPHGLRDVAALGARPGRRARGGPGGGRRAAAPPRPVPQRVRRPGARRPDASTAACSSAGVLAGLVLADAEPDDPTLADGLLVCATEVTTSAEIALRGRALRGPRPLRHPGGRAIAGRRCRVSVTGERLQPTIFERGRPGRGGGKIPHPPKDALDRIPAAARRARAAGAARDERARRRPPLRQPVAAQLRGRHRVLPARLVHDEVQPEAQRVGRPPAGLRQPPPAGTRRDRAGHPPAAVGARARPGRDLRACAPSASSRRPAPRAS